MNKSNIVGRRIERQPDFAQFLKVLKRQGKPAHLPFYEHLASSGFISTRLGRDINAARSKREYWQLYADFWLSLGFDCIPLEIGFSFGPIQRPEAEHQEGLGFTSEANVCVRSMADFERLPWPDEAHPIDLEPFEIVAEYMPEGTKIVGGPCGGPYECVTINLLGVVGLSYALTDQPELVDAVFKRLKTLYVTATRQLAAMSAVGACRQGDDLGFKTSTFLAPPLLREHVFPIYREMAAAAHACGKPFILHSCGNLGEVYEDLIGCGIDAKHSFEDVIMPVAEFQRQYGKRITPLGGLDVDMLCRGSESELRRYTRNAIEKCLADGGYWALGTGNSLTDYMPVDNYLIVLEEAVRSYGRYE
jgi:uroporphyrinogen decarboxylase